MNPKILSPAAPSPHGQRLRGEGARAWYPWLRLGARLAFPLVSIFGLWYLAIALSDLPEFVIPRPAQVFAVLTQETSFVTHHLLVTLQAAAWGFLLANVAGVALAVLFVAVPFANPLLMPAAITLRNIPYVALASVLVLAVGDGLWTRVAIVAVAGFFPVLVNTMRGLEAVDAVVLDRMRILDVPAWKVFLKVRLPYSLPYVLAAQEITGSGSIIVAVVAEWMVSTEGLGFVINRGMAQYRGDQVYAVALLAALLSYLIFVLVQVTGRRINWSERMRQDGH